MPDGADTDAAVGPLWSLRRALKSPRAEIAARLEARQAEAALAHLHRVLGPSTRACPARGRRTRPSRHAPATTLPWLAASAETKGSIHNDLSPSERAQARPSRPEPAGSESKAAPNRRGTPPRPPATASDGGLLVVGDRLQGLRRPVGDEDDSVLQQGGPIRPRGRPELLRQAPHHAASPLLTPPGPRNSA